MADDQLAKCEELSKRFNESSAKACPPNFDGVNCWPATAGETTAELPCPIIEGETISRWCSASISAITSDNNRTIFEWYPANNADCSLINIIENNMKGVPHPTLSDLDINLYWWHLRLYMVVRLGYAVSTFALSIALSIFTLRPRLRNTRVKIHTHFFVSLALQAITWLTQGMIYGHRIFYSIITGDVHSGVNPSILCRALMTLGNYFELCSFSWILMESWYFYSFICLAPYKECTTVKPLIICGWGLPVIVMIPYLITYSLASETNFCWVDVDAKSNIVAVPILLMVLINCSFFVLNVKVLFIKLNCSVLHQRQKHFWKWFRSTLMLVPLFGAHDIFFCMEPWIEDKTIKTQFYNAVRVVCAFQGLLVSILYCFINNEVRSELRRVYGNWATKREIDCNFEKQKMKTKDSNNPMKSQNQSRNNSLSGSTELSLNTSV
ncbi:orphan G-protein coupled receptor [Nasonia vitripennis]|uniref:Uncharacterized protein n=1 Tax=Nasonia vitripennis TaxID=7425 RepID=A0A7M6W5Q0_NASVI|nr:orphan G-protein coupled receptor [Nasonia vitripennis]